MGFDCSRMRLAVMRLKSGELTEEDKREWILKVSKALLEGKGHGKKVPWEDESTLTPTRSSVGGECNRYQSGILAGEERADFKLERRQVSRVRRGVSLALRGVLISSFHEQLLPADLYDPAFGASVDVSFLIRSNVL